VVEHLPGKREAPSSIPGTRKNKNPWRVDSRVQLLLFSDG
jgi:hypothetical protein